ncbi:minor capsid protein [Fructilactobacillus vespulae]|uniref:minor capsid protein n=1 Tax=Fructilactobacillus vespulae TaxID=1249630 RepID=UPI0039B3E96E
MADYWEERALQIKANQVKNAKRYEEQLKNRFEPVQAEIESLIDKFVHKYAKAHGLSLEQAQDTLSKDDFHTWKETLNKWEDMSDDPEYKYLYEAYMTGEYAKSRISRLDALKQQITDMLATYTSNETDEFADTLMNSYSDTYYKTTHMIQNGLGTYSSDFQKLDERILKSVINQNWQGSNFSKRLWGNMVNTLPSYLEKSLFKGASLGYDSKQMVNEARQVFKNMKDYELHRLIVTEMGHVDETATQSSYKENKLEQYRYLATLESRTCVICGELDHKIFNVKDIERGINYPLIHPHCRCTTAPYIKDIDSLINKKRWSKNIFTNKSQEINSMSYNDWISWVRKSEGNKILGKTTRDEIKINRVSEHAFDRMLERNRNATHIIDAIENPLRIRDKGIDKSGRPSKEYIGEFGTAVVNPETGTIVTTFPTSSNRVRKLKNDK